MSVKQHVVSVQCEYFIYDSVAFNRVMRDQYRGSELLAGLNVRLWNGGCIGDMNFAALGLQHLSNNTSITSKVLEGNSILGYSRCKIVFLL